MGLALNRTHASHLKHQPLYHFRAPPRIRRQQTSRFLGKVDKDRPRFENRKLVGTDMVYDGWNPPVGIDLEIPVFFLLALFQIEDLKLILQAKLFKSDGDFVTVRGRTGIKL